MGPNECKYCGCTDTIASCSDSVTFACRTYCGGIWVQRSDTCGSQVGDLYRRIQRAVAVLEGATRFDFVASCMPHMDKRSDGEFIEHDEAEQALEILRGNSPESPDSSSVTADQLAVSDYYEAVRQQVPWMVTIEHIEGLVEGYRRCGVMVWQAAELIKLIFGGGNEQAE